MARCSTCKRVSWPLHKYKGYVVCESCLTGGWQITGRSLFRWFHGIRTWIFDTVKRGYERIRGIKHIDTTKPIRKKHAISHATSAHKGTRTIRIGSSYRTVG